MEGAENNTATIDAHGTAMRCSICRREVLIGESMSTFHDERLSRTMHACDLCRPTAVARGWEMRGTPELRRARGRRLRVEVVPQAATVAAHASHDLAEVAPRPTEPSAPERAVLERVAGSDVRPDASPQLLDRIRRQDAELARMRREFDPARRMEEQRLLRRQEVELRELRAAVSERDARIERLQLARHAETSPMRMSRFALDAFNQSDELERMSRIARTLGAPTINVHDEGPGIPRRVRLTLVWEIAWYEFMVKLDLGANRASVHATGTGGDPAALPLERRRANAEWRDSGILI